jgi:hypothetical protein
VHGLARTSRIPDERLGLVRAVVVALPEDELTRTVLAQVTSPEGMRLRG